MAMPTTNGMVMLIGMGMAWVLNTVLRCPYRTMLGCRYRTIARHLWTSFAFNVAAKTLKICTVVYNLTTLSHYHPIF